MKYKIPINWMATQTFEVEAENLESAITLAYKEFLNIPDANYVEDSMEVDGIVEDNYPHEDYNIKTIWENI